MKQKVILSARASKYLDEIKRYPIYSTLLVLDEYEKKELYLECAEIKNALDEYGKDKMVPTSLKQYFKKDYQTHLEKTGSKVDNKTAERKAKLIKAKLPVNEL